MSDGEKKGLERLYAHYDLPAPVEPPEGAGMDLPGDGDGDAPVLDRAMFEELKRQFASEPSYTLERVRKVYDAEMTEEEFRDALVDLEVVFADPDAHVQNDLAFEAGLGKTKLPDDFVFPGMDTGKLPIDTTDSRFETRRDIVGWILNAGPFAVRSVIHQPKFNFRWAENHPSLFFYPMRGAGTTRIALFGDAGTGLYHSRYIGKQIAAAQYDHVIYLGDVYYSGKSDEFKNRFLGEQDFGPAIQKHSFWSLNANHEMFSRGVPYMQSIDARRKAQPHLHQQEGSYFCLRGDGFQIIGIDTSYHDNGRHAEGKLAFWLQQALVDGKNRGLINILCSSDEPYTIRDTALKPLFTDVTRNLPPNTIDLWVFANVHYAAFFDRDHDKRATFLGACIGHGGYPYPTKSENDRWSAVPVRWVETEARFPAWTGVRQDKGNNGYMTLELNHQTGGATLKFIDWTSDVRYELALGRKLPGGPLVILDEKRHARGEHKKKNG